MITAQLPLEEILNTVMLEEQEPTHQALLRWSDLYPAYRDDLAQFFAHWALQIELPETASVDDEGVANRLVSHALMTLHQKRENSSGKANGSPARLLAFAMSCKVTIEDMAARCRLDEEILAKLDLRRILNVPRICLAMLGNTLGCPASPLDLLITGPPILSAGTSHKSKKRPTPSTEDFADSIRNSSLSDEDKQFWYDVIASEKSESEQT